MDCVSTDDNDGWHGIMHEKPPGDGDQEMPCQARDGLNSMRQSFSNI